MEVNKELKCVVCGSKLYPTDHGFYETTYHCASKEAMFWNFGRGTKDESESKDHWDKSMMEVKISQKDLVV